MFKREMSRQPPTPPTSGVLHCFRLRCLSSSQHRHQCHPCCLFEWRPVWVLPSHLSSRRSWVFWSVLVVKLGRTPDADDPSYESGACGGMSCSESSASFFWGSDSERQKTPALFSMPLVPGSLVARCSTASASARLILPNQPRPIGRIQTSRLSTSLRSSSDMLRCELAVAHGQFSSTNTQDNLH